MSSTRDVAPLRAAARRFLLVLLVAATPAAMSATAAAASTSTSMRFPGTYRGSDPVVDGGRVWGLTLESGTSTDAILTSVRLDGRDRQTVTLPLPRPLRLTEAIRQDPTLDPVLSVRDDRAAILLRWASSADTVPGGNPTEPPYYAEYDIASGERTRLVQDQSVIAQLYRGEFPTDPLRLRDPVLTSGHLEVRFSGTTSRFGIDNSRTLQTGGTEFGHDGWGRATVIDRRTGRARYSVTARALGRSAVPAHDDGVVDIAGLQDDGSLTVYATRRSAFDGTGRSATRGDVRPIRVDPAGRVRAMGRPQRRILATAGLYGGGRGLVFLDDRRRCQQYFITNASGSKGRHLARQTKDRSYAPMFWNGTTAVWPAARYDSEDGTNGTFPTQAKPWITIDRQLQETKLRPQAPRC